MPTFPDEELIERYVLGPETMPPPQREAAEALLTTSAAAREIAALLRLFYDEFEQAEKDLTPQVEAFVDRLFATPRVIALRPTRFRQPAPTLLAARTEPPKPPIEAVATLASKRDGVLVRLLCDHATGICQVYAMSQVPEVRAHALLTLSPPEITLTLDEWGRATFPAPEHPEALSKPNLRARLIPPVAHCSVAASDLAPEPLSRTLASGHTLRCTYLGGVLTLEVEPPPGETAPSRAALFAGEKTHLMTLYRRRGHLDLAKPPANGILRLYA